MSFKRPRSPNSVLSSRSPSPEPTSKSARTRSSAGESSTHPLLCTLPPTCNPPSKPTHLVNTKELEAHYAKYHAHVCEERGCRCVFPDARLLELHQTECHDPIAAVRRERGEKIFACHLVSCQRTFLTPKARRLHLIQAHGYPKEYFFAVTNKGVGGLLKKWGEGASMIRGEWKARERGESEEEGDEAESAVVSGHEDTIDTLLEDTKADKTRQSVQQLRDGPLIEEDDDDEPEGGTLDHLASSMNTLSLVPATVRFGRGGKREGFSHSGHSQQARHHTHESMEVDAANENAIPGSTARSRGRRGSMMPPRSRGNGHGVGRHTAEGENSQVPLHSRPPMPPRGLGVGRRGRFPGRGLVRYHGRGMSVSNSSAA